MKKLSVTKKIISFVLVIAVVLSCMVFAIPLQSSAADADEGKYYVEVKFTVDYAAELGKAYPGLDANGNPNSSTDDTVGISLGYKENNGSSSTVKYHNIDIGSKGNNEINSNGDHTVSAVLSGYPTMLYAGIDDNWIGIAFWATPTRFHITELRVGSDSSNMKTIWTGTFSISSKCDFHARSIDISGSVKSDYSSTTEDSGNNYINNSSGSWSNQLPTPSTFYYGNGSQVGDRSVGYRYDDTDTAMEKRYEIPKSGSKTVPVVDEPTTAKDQYGVTIVTTPSYKFHNSSDAVASMTGISMNSSTGVLTVSSAARMASGNTTQCYTEKVWTAGGGSASVESRYFYLKDPQYTATFNDLNGNPLKSDLIYYGDSTTVPSNPSNYHDDNYHYTFNAWIPSSLVITNDTNFAPNYIQESHSYTAEVIKDATCTSAGQTKYTCSCGYTYTADEPEALGHSYSDWETVTEATCEKAGIAKRTCATCGNIDTKELPALGHDKQIVEIAPTDQTQGYIYYECANGCGTVWASKTNAETGSVEPATEPSASLDEVIENTDPVPAPSFNTFSDPLINYDYSNRGAGLKLDDINYVGENTIQNTRFTGSMLIPDGIDCSFSTDKNSVTDFGFVYSQSELIDYDISLLEIGKNNIYKMSVADQNSGTFTGANWSGVTTHDTENGKFLTFNLLIAIKAKNWTKDYCARAYITYNYMGFTYTVYDQDFSSRSVQYIAENVVANETETPFARNYCQTKILDHI